MPAQVSAATRLPWNGTVADEPPPPAPSLLDSIPAALRSSVDAVPFQQNRRLGDAYMAIDDALNEMQGRRPDLLNSGRETLNYGAFFGQDKRDAVWNRLDALRKQGVALPKDLSAIPADRQEFERQTIGRGSAHMADVALAARGGWFPQLVGGVGASFTDPVNLVGGAALGRVLNTASLPVLRGMLLEGAGNAALELGQTPDNVAARKKLGEKATVNLPDTLVSMGEAFVFGAALHGAGRGAQAGFEKAVAASWDHLPEGLRTRWAARTTLDPAGQDKLLADMTTALIGPERMTDAEAGAAAQLTRQAEIDSVNPFAPNGAGVAAHADFLAERMAAIMRDTPTAPSQGRAFVPGDAIARGGDTALATGVVAGDAQARFMAKVRSAESSGNDAAAASTSSAFGRYQFTAGTWIGYYTRRFGTGGLTRAEILAKRSDPHINDMLMADLTADNAKRLTGMGAPVTEGNLYLMHLLGPTDAERVLRASPDTPLAGLIHDDSIAANRGIMEHKTAADIRAFAARKMGSVGDDGAGLHLNPATDMAPDFRAQIDAELADVRAQAAKLEADLQAQGIDVEQIVRDATGDDNAVPVEPVAADGSPVPLAEPLAQPSPQPLPVERTISPEAEALLPAVRAAVADKAQSLKDLDALAARLGTTRQHLEEGLNELVREGGLARRRDSGTFVRRPQQRAKGDLSLLEWIAERGGISDGFAGFKGGDLKAMGFDKWHRQAPFRRRLLRPYDPNPRGVLTGQGQYGIDSTFRDAIDAGYFPEWNTLGNHDMDVQPFIDAMVTELDGNPIYPEGSAKRPAPVESGLSGDSEHEAALQAERDWIHGSLSDAAERMGMDPALIDDDLLNYAAALYFGSDGGAYWADVLSRAVNDYADATRWAAVDESGHAGYEELDYEWPHASENPEPGSEAGAAARDRGGPQGDGTDPTTGGAGRGDAGSDAEGAPPALADMPREETRRFLDPEGEAAKAQADDLEHEAIAAMDEAAQARALAEQIGKADVVKPERQATNFRDARAAVKAFQGKVLVNAKNGVRAVLSRSTLDKMLSMKALDKSTSTADHLAALVNADHLFEAGHEFAVHADARGEPTLRAIRRFVTIMERKDGPVAVKITVKETADPEATNPLYTVETISLENIGAKRSGGPGEEAPSQTGGIEWAPGNEPNAPHAGSDADIGNEPKLDNGQAVDPNVAAKARQENGLAAQQPLTGARKTGKAQDATMPEGLFGGPAEPTFDLGDGSEPKSMADLLRELDDDDAANATIRDCMDPKPTNPGAGE